VRREGNVASKPKSASALMTPGVEMDQSEDISGRSKMGPPLEKPAKPADGVEPYTPCPKTDNPQTSHMPTPLESSQRQPQQADAGSVVVIGDDSDDEAGEEDSGDADEFGDQDWLDALLIDGDNGKDDGASESAPPAGESSVPASKPAPKLRPVLGDLAAEAADAGITPAIRKLIIKDIQSAPREVGSFAYEIGGILDFVLDGAHVNHLPETEFYFNIVPDMRLSLDDVLSLWHMRGQENAAWFTDRLMHSLLDVDAMSVANVFVDYHLDHFLMDEYSDNLLGADINAAKQGREPTLGWPLVDMRKEHTRILATVNPTKSHWVTVEVTLTKPPKLLLYNSLRSASGKGPTIRRITKTLPQLLYLASLRPGSPLAGFDPHGLELEDVECPQQAGSFDCGPFSLWSALRRLYEQPVWRNLPNKAETYRFGNWLRHESARIVLDRICGGSNYSFKSLFDKDDELTEELRKKAEAEEAHRLAEARTAELHRLNEQAQIAQYLADNNLVEHSITGGPALPDVADSANEPGIEADEGENADPEYTGIYRQEHGRRNDAHSTIIVVIRFSSAPRWWKESAEDGAFEAAIMDIQQQRIQSYVAAAGLPATEQHIIVHAAKYVLTRHMPLIGVPRISQKELPEGADRFSASCPFCEWTATSEKLHDIIRSAKCHYVTHRPEFSCATLAAQSQPNGTGYSYRCKVDGCNHRTKSKSKRKAVLYASSRDHWATEHSSAWLEEEGKSWQFRCNCEDCTLDGDRVWENIADFRKHGRVSIDCPVCSKKFTTTQKLGLHMSTNHWDDNVPRDWHRCHLPLPGEPWSTMRSDIRTRLIRFSGKSCVWAMNGADCCETSKAFPTDAQLEQHYDQVHADETWAHSSGNEILCGYMTTEPDKLQRHVNTKHAVNSDIGTGYNKAYRLLEMNRAQVFTEAITKDLHSSSQAATPPVLLSIGLDGFTCNTRLMQSWLKEIDIDFEFAIWTSKTPGMNEQHFTRVDEAYIGRYDSRELLRCLEDRSQAPEAYKDLVKFWAEKQQIKDGQSRLHAPRNILGELVRSRQ
jgi:hypothetical protein